MRIPTNNLRKGLFALAKRIEIPYEQLYDLYVEKEMSISEVSKTLGIGYDAVKARIKEYNIPIRKSGVYNRKYCLNEQYFDSIDTPRKAYMLGLITADGYVAHGNKRGNVITLGLGLQLRDAKTVEFFRDELESNAPLKIKDNSIGVTVCSVHLCNTLANYGIVPNKSLILNIADVIEKAKIGNDLIPSFLLGFFDGDGGIYESKGNWSCGFTGTKESCEFLKEYFNCGFIIDEHSSGGNTFTYKMSGKNQVYNGLSILYSDDCSYCMERKYKKFLALKSLVR